MHLDKTRTRHGMRALSLRLARIGRVLLFLLPAVTLALRSLAVPVSAAPLAQSGKVTFFSVALSGVTEIPGPGDRDGSGVMDLRLDADQGAVCYNLTTTRIDNPGAAHIHRGAEGASGPVDVTLFDTTAAPGGSSQVNTRHGCVPVAPALIDEMAGSPSGFYVNVHNAPFPAGALRGQLATESTLFTVRVENISGDSSLPTPFAPGVWAVYSAMTTPLFDVNTPDRGEGLADLAEDGATGPLAAALQGKPGILSSGVYSVPLGASGPGPIFSGGAYQFDVIAKPGDHLSLASMLVQSNDIFVGPGPNGIGLFDTDGTAISGDITGLTSFWDTGTEVNEAPGMGPDQAPRQPAPNTGASEGGVTAFSNSTRSLPLANRILHTTLAQAGGVFTFTLRNTSAISGALATPISPLVYVTHDRRWQLFSHGQQSSSGLEAVAEDGNAPALVAEVTGATGVGMVDAALAGAGPGEEFVFSVTPTLSHPYLSIVGMVVESNDAFLAFGPLGISLLDYAGMPRAQDDILDDFQRMLAVWDAGTEANEVPGVGPNQPLRQVAPNTGPADPNAAVRIYSDPANDLAGEDAGGFGQLTVINGATPGTFTVTLQNTSDATVYPGLLAPVVWAIHSDAVQLFQPGAPASEGLERLAEDGNPTFLSAELSGATGITLTGIVDTPVGAGSAGPLAAGDTYSFTVVADAAHSYLSVASMIVPSNDTFFAFEPAGLRLLNQDGTPRSDAELAADITSQRLAWDAGTERNQAGAAGPDQAPYQSAADTGADEGSGNVTLLDDPVWGVPQPQEVVRITIHPRQTSMQMAQDPVLPVDHQRPVTTFHVRLENHSANTTLPSPFAPGAWAVHNAGYPIFSQDMPDRGLGLADIAEDGNPGSLASSLANRAGVVSSGAFDTPVGASSPAPILPGEAYEFEVTTTPTATRLSLATMFVQSNDLFAAPASAGIPLFDQNGNPFSGDISSLLSMWDAGTEMNEAPGMGPNQAPRQSAPNTGPGEGGVSEFNNSTRSLPLAGGIVDVAVSEISGAYQFTVTNSVAPPLVSGAAVSAVRNALVTPVGPLFYVTHDSQWMLFRNGQTASAGLESLAEDGSPAALVAASTGATGVGMVGSVGSAPIATGDSHTFTVTPDAAHPYLSIAAMVVETNDVFLAFASQGLRLLDISGQPRAAADVMADFNLMLAVWDAGTEANEVPGVGPNQAPRQAGPNTGPADPQSGVRIYSDATNDLSGDLAGGFVGMTVEYGPHPLSFVVTISNASDATAYPGLLTPVAWAIHNQNYALFHGGEQASSVLESLAEDGNVDPLLAELGTAFGVGNAGVEAVPVGAGSPGPLMPGQSYSFLVTADTSHPYLSLAQMIVPSNDTFLAFGSKGLRLLDEAADRRPLSEIAQDIAVDLTAWDAGTERNQTGAAGPDQAPRQSGPNTGAGEGPGTVRLLTNTVNSADGSIDSVWAYPTVEEVLRVTIEPMFAQKAYLPAVAR